MKFLSNLDINLNQLLNAVLHLLGTDPGSPTDGQIWYRTDLDEFRVRRNGVTETIVTDINVTAPITSDGNLSAPTLGISAATSGAAGSMSAADKTKLDAATDAATASTLVMRDANSRFKAADPSAGTDVANKQYVDNAIAGLDWKDSVRVATTAAGTLASDFENGDTVDGVVLATNDRILIKNQAAPEENGIYFVNASGAPTRTTDADTAAEILQAAVWVREGTTNADSGWVLTTNSPITLGTTGLTFAQFNAGTAYTAGAGMTLTGNTFDVVGNAGRIVVNANDVDLASGVATPGTYTSVTVDTYGRVTAGTNPTSLVKFSASVGDTSSTSIAVTHNLGTKDVNVMVYRVASPFDQVFPDIEMTDTNNVTVKFSVAPSTNEYRVVVIG